MAINTRISGKNLYVEFGGVDLSADFRSLGPSESCSTIDVTAGDDGVASYIAGTKDGSASLTYLDVTGATGTAQWAAVVPGTSGTLIWGEEGTAAGKPKHTVPALVTARSKSIPYDGALECSVTFQFNQAAVSDTVWS